MSSQVPMLIIVVPLFTALLLVLSSGFLSRRFAYGLLVTALSASFFAALVTLGQVLEGGVLHYRLGDWPPSLGIELVIDHLNGMVLVLVSGCALLTAIYSRQTAEQDNPDRLNQYYALFSLLVTGLLGMTATGDVFNLYVLLEISALSSYGLLARGRGPAYYATFKYLVVGTIGACFYLLGVGYLYIKTGTLNMAALSELLAQPAAQESLSIRIGFTLIMIGVWVKMALFPLHAWMPNAYSKAGITTACLIAPLMTKVSVYIMIRLMFSVFSVDYVFTAIPWHDLVSWLAVVAIVVGSLTALAQQDLRKMLAYIIVAEVGYMVGGAWLANGTGLTGVIYHILSDALMTLCLFMAVGAIIYRTGKSTSAAMAGIFARMPVTSAVFVLGGFSIIGIPPTCGFFSKWYLISGGIEAGHWAYVAALLFSSLVNAVIFFRLIEIAYFGDLAAHGHQAAPARNEAPLTMLLPMVVVAVLLIVVGLYTGEIVTALVGKAIPPGL